MLAGAYGLPAGSLDGQSGVYANSARPRRLTKRLDLGRRAN
jgi:hypothetical protein